MPAINKCTLSYRSITFAVLLYTCCFLAVIQDDCHSSDKNTGLPGKSAAQFMRQGRAASDRGHFVQAVGHWKSAYAIYLAGKQPDGQVRALYSIGRALHTQGYYPRALKKLHTALNLTPDIKTVKLHAQVLDALGQVYMQIGATETARQYLETGLQIAADPSLSEIRAAILISLGNLALFEKNDDAGLDYYRQSAVLAQRADKPALVARAQINIARTFYELKQFDKALPLLARALKTVQKLPDTHDKAYTLTAIGRLYSCLHDAAPDILPEKGCLRYAFQALKAAATVAASLNDKRASSYALGYSGALYESQQRFQEALQLTYQAIAALQKVYAPEILYHWQWQAGRLLTVTGTPEKAISAYQRAVHYLKYVRDDLAAVCQTCTQPSFRQRAEPVYLQLADLLLQRSETSDDNSKIQTDLKDVRDYMEQLKIIEMQDYFKDECIIALEAKETALDKIISNTAIVYPIAFPQRLELLVTFPDRMRRFRSPVSAGELMQTVNSFRDSLEQPRTRQHRFYGAKLYNWLIRPLQDDLSQRSIKTIVFAPSGLLRTIPMAALYDQKRKRFLIEQYAVATTPGLTLTAPRKIPRENVRILISALTQAVKGFNELIFIPDEIENIKKLYDCTVLKNEAFTFDNMAKAHADTFYTMIHIASHGQFQSDPEQTFLLTFNEKLTMDALREVIEPGLHRDKAVELLTLSACQTAAGDERAALGLAGVGIKAGARTVMASLWFIDDESAAKLVSAFYKQLKDSSLSRAQALQNAQLQMLKQRRFRHPAHWAAFLLIGNWL